jgi:8-oxo-dGTP diphosphatase
MEESRSFTVVAAALIDGEGRILLQRRAEGRAMAGLWEFPGGKVEAGERPEEALARELEEELGVEVRPDALRPFAFASADNAGRHMLLLLFTCDAWHGSPRPLDADALIWARPREMRTLAMPPADRPLVDLLERLLLRHGVDEPSSRT